jgi:hypothetical protein
MSYGKCSEVVKRTYFNDVTHMSQYTLSALWRNSYSQVSEERIV